jgi:hypothetical protein
MADEHDDGQGGPAPGLGRRGFLTGVATSVGALGILGSRTTTAAAASGRRPAVAPITRHTIEGLLAFIVPGNDAYSRRQGVTTGRPGGVGSGAAPFLERTYDEALPLPLVGNGLDISLPGSILVTTLLDSQALAVNPLAAVGPFLSPFANLAYDHKVEVMRRLEEETPLFDGTIVRFLVNTVPTLAGFEVYSEAPVLDRTVQPRRITRRPVGWDLSSYPGVSDGWDELLGYYRGVDHVPR